ncbi:MAG: A/G-specific adenine glycosylase [Geodermatophilaceae bacterium]|nr:A/G-specific adenine glycosylase [Geodermatophilaceae bacterium]
MPGPPQPALTRRGSIRSALDQAHSTRRCPVGPRIRHRPDSWLQRGGNDIPGGSPSAAPIISEIIGQVIAWYGDNARDLPWRHPGTSPWAVLVSEVMLQQTPVPRVRPVYETWLHRWPGAGDLAADSPGEAVRMWGKLGYPRRALRLHEAAVVITDRYAGVLPADLPSLLSLPGVGDYTARAVASFAFGQRHAVVDTNVRRFTARAVLGQGAAAPPSVGRDLALVESMLPAEPVRAARFSVAAMELGALVCTARTPSCPACPVRSRCAWQLAGRPAYDGPVRPAQRFAGTDRQVRGLLLDVLRSSYDAVPDAALTVAGSEAGQQKRALASLLGDGLVVVLPDGRYALPGGPEG